MGKNTQFFKGWLEPFKGKTQTSKVCKKELAAVVTAFKKYSKTQYQIELASELYDPTLVRIDSVLVDNSMTNIVRDTELCMAAFLT